jgi:hypothetical protein
LEALAVLEYDFHAQVVAAIQLHEAQGLGESVQIGSGHWLIAIGGTWEKIM